MVLGINQFGHLYEDVPVAANEDQNAQSASSTNAGLTSSSQNEYDKRLRDCFFTEEFRWYVFYH
jgi:hypothetical protein